MFTAHMVGLGSYLHRLKILLQGRSSARPQQTLWIDAGWNVQRILLLSTAVLFEIAISLPSYQQFCPLLRRQRYKSRRQDEYGRCAVMPCPKSDNFLPPSYPNTGELRLGWLRCWLEFHLVKLAEICEMSREKGC